MRHRETRFTVLFAVMCAVLFVVSGGQIFAGGSSETGTSPQATSTQQQPTGNIVIYTPMNNEQIETLIGAFNEEYPGIKVEYFRAGQEELFTKLDLEIQTQQIQADLVVGIDPARAKPILGNFVAYQPAGIDQVVDSLRDPNGILTPFGIDILLIMYNTKYISKQDAPKNWAELLDPKFQNKIVVANPKSAGSVHPFIWMVTDYMTSKGAPYGWDYFKGFAKLNPLFTSGHSGARSYVASGERPLGPEMPIGNVTQSTNAGETTAYNIPEEGIPSTPFEAAVFKTSKQRAAAEKFVDFLITKKAQTLIADKVGYVPVGKGLDYRLPQGEDVSQYKLVPVLITPELRAMQAEKFTQIMNENMPK